MPASPAVRVARPASLPPPGAKLVVVEASAGTGKTFFLEHRVVDLILGVGAELPQILLVTFTEKAVAELRMRIRDLLDRLARTTADTVRTTDAAGAHAYWELDAAARRRLRAAIAAFDHAPIFTIHGYCHRILIEDAFAAQRLFHQQQVADEVAFDAAFAALLRERFARVRPDRDLLGAFLETERTVDKLRDILLGCARAGEDARVRRLGAWQLTPYVGADHVRLDNQGFEEWGSALALRAEAATLTRTQATAGLRASRDWRGARLHAWSEWQQTLQADGFDMQASFTGIDSWSPLPLADAAKSGGMFGLGLETWLGRNAQLSLAFDQRFGPRGNERMGSVRYVLGF